MESPPERPRRPFEHLRDAAPESFVGSTEFQRILWFAGLAAFLALFALWVLGREQAASVENQPAAEAARPPPTPAELEARRNELYGAFEGALSDSANGDDFAETPGYLRLVTIVASFSPDEVHARVRRRVDYAKAIAEPDLWRGEFVTARGLMSWMGAEKLSRPILGIHDVWRGVLTDPDPDAPDGIVIDLVTDPPPFEERSTVVDVEGVFYRTVKFENRRGEIKEAPYLIARNFRVVDTKETRPASFLRDHTGATLIGMAVVFGLTRLLMYFFQRRNRKRPVSRTRPAATDFHAMFEKHRRAEDRRAGPRPPA